MVLDRREFIGGGLASMMAVLLGVSPQEATAMMEAAETHPDDALVFLIDGTCYAPLIRVEGVIKALDISTHVECDDVTSSAGMVVQRFLREPVFTARFTGPFTVKFSDERKFWGRS